MALIDKGGKATVSEVAQALLAEDQAQLDYYREITKRMPGAVLRRRGVIDYQDGAYAISGFDEMTAAERHEMMALCHAKVDAFLEKRSDPWSHRRKSAGYVSGALRYEVLKRAMFRCELCGASAEDRALEVESYRSTQCGRFGRSKQPPSALLFATWFESRLSIERAERLIGCHSVQFRLHQSLAVGSSAKFTPFRTTRRGRAYRGSAGVGMETRWPVRLCALRRICRPRVPRLLGRMRRSIRCNGSRGARGQCDRGEPSPVSEGAAKDKGFGVDPCSHGGNTPTSGVRENFIPEKCAVFVGQQKET